jgi:membrane-associated protease RseP (regulator of RpoE activity)
MRAGILVGYIGVTKRGAPPFLVGEVPMLRVALAMTLVGLMAACIPPDQNWSSQPAYPGQPYPGQPYQSQPQGSAQSGNDFDDNDNNNYPTGYGNATAGGSPSPRRGFLGFLAQDPKSGAGVMVVEVVPGSPAASAGLRVGDRIGAVNGRPIGSFLELSRVSAVSPGTVLRLSVRRDHRVRDVAVTVGEPPARLPDDSLSSTNRARGRRAAPSQPGSSGSSGSGQWHCRAVGTYARGTSTGGPDYANKQNIDVTKYGATRDEAGVAAIKECASMLNLETVTLPDSGNLVLEYCRAISCSR